MARDPLPPATSDMRFWRTLQEQATLDVSDGSLHDEFPRDATVWPTDLSRRDFLRGLGASFALAGLAGCGDRPREEIVPYVNPPEAGTTDAPLSFATAFSAEGFARGILVRSNLGRPTKIEGNPDHPESLGATDAITQAAVLSLYDPDRSRVPQREGNPSLWSLFENEWNSRRAEFADTKGAGLALLTEPTSSPTTLRAIHRFLDVYPQARWYQHTPLARYDLDGAQADYDFSAAEVIFSIGSDFLYQHPAAVRYAAGYAQRRSYQGSATRLSRFYALEPTPTVTGVLADFRLPVSGNRIRTILDAIARTLGVAAGSGGDRLSPEEQHFVSNLSADLQRYGAHAVCVAGPELDADLQRWARALNSRLGSVGTVFRLNAPVRSDGDTRCAGGLSEFVQYAAGGGFRAAFILGSNPVYTAPSDVEVRDALRATDFSVHLGSHADETGSLCRWHLPESHFLETWSDLRGYDGTATIVQPLIEPLHASSGAAELLHLLSDSLGKSGYDLVRETWTAAAGPDRFESRWHQWLTSGKITDVSLPGGPIQPPAAALPLLSSGKAIPADVITVVIRPDANVLDGRWANNAWLQELPRPHSRIVWDNAAVVSSALAAELKLADGDLIALEGAHDFLEAPVWVLPGQAPRCIALTLGYGRHEAGEVGTGRGYDAYRIRKSNALWERTDLKVRKLGRRYPLVSTQGHFMMEGRDIARVFPVGQIPREPEREPGISLYPEWDYKSYAWSMSIDLGTCIGCNACVVACQAENNIPVVGKDQVARGREMHWLRVDRYFQGDPANPRVVLQPVPCMHCENAPCELVCPVGATVHSSEGLNDMVYNRCVGTRYCSNNCPYKVRRFNFLDYREPPDSAVYLQKNPNVTVRERGVMEKCTYCVQRINRGRITAEKENRAIRDGEIKTACQQVCPTRAIVFGNLHDPTSEVARWKKTPISYGLLAELNTRPRTTYLAKLVADPAEALVPATGGSAG